MMIVITLTTPGQIEHSWDHLLVCHLPGSTGDTLHVHFPVIVSMSNENMTENTP